MITPLSATNNNIALFQDGISSVQNNSENTNKIKMFEQDENGNLHMTDTGKAVLIIGGIYIVGEYLGDTNKNNKETLEVLNEEMDKSEESQESQETPANKTSFGEVVVGLLLAWVANIAHKMETEK